MWPSTLWEPVSRGAEIWDTRQDANNSWEILYQDLDVKNAISVGGFRVP